MKHRRGFAALLLAAAGSTAVALAPAQPASAATFYTIQNFGSGKCIQPPPANSTDIGVQLVQMTCNGSAAQRWAPISLGGGQYRFLNQSTGGCLDAHGPNANKTPVDTWACNSISNEKWQVTPAIPNSVPARIVSAIGSRCLDVAGGSPADGAPIQIYACTDDNPAQVWLIR
ncbi:RICIN domain-containing protein [Micromonospora rubida]